MTTDNEPETAVEQPLSDIAVTINGEERSDTVEPRLKLSDYLRNACGLSGVRVGCEHGVCGACTVLVDGEPVKSCLMYGVQADGKAVETVEGLAEEGELHPIQEAFHEEYALQCGFCTSGFVMSTKALLEENPDPDDETIESELSGNLCRCTGYQPIYDAVHRAAETIEGDE
ncbi:(2Fe-2S)-binding protein [Natrinema longum]|uniref:(2Fe-2S)-binding protein n=1 Tax=Natrinema longum TaxID=370324 RepID=UPI00240290E2|nr:(2Fe-2S)-binding protein [Natrinema longum]MBZ6497084.1 (2Fe-2S)-binding protein [Natrinema longum]